VVTAQRVRVGASPELIGYGEAEALALADDAARRAGEREAGTGVSAEAARACADGVDPQLLCARHRLEAQLRAPFEAVGFAFEQCAPGGPPPGTDRPGTPRRNAGSRWRIIARRPSEATA
jgi:hypothetical protein